MYSDFEWNWKVYMDGQNECYHCDKLHGQTPCMLGIDFDTTTIRVSDEGAGIFDYHMRGREIDVTLNHVGRTIFPPIEGLSEEQRWVTHSIVIAPGPLHAAAARQRDRRQLVADRPDARSAPSATGSTRRPRWSARTSSSATARSRSRSASSSSRTSGPSSGCSGA